MKRYWHPDELAAHWTMLPEEQPLLDSKLAAPKLLYFSIFRSLLPEAMSHFRLTRVRPDWLS